MAVVGTSSLSPHVSSATPETHDEPLLPTMIRLRMLLLRLLLLRLLIYGTVRSEAINKR